MSSQDVELKTLIKILKMRCEMINFPKHLNNLKLNTASHIRRTNYDGRENRISKFYENTDRGINKQMAYEILRIYLKLQRPRKTVVPKVVITSII